MVLEDDAPPEPASSPDSPRNLSAWSVAIPYIDVYDDDVKREKVPVFCIDVERKDRKEGERGAGPNPGRGRGLTRTVGGAYHVRGVRSSSRCLWFCPQWVTTRSGGPCTGGTWSSTCWSPNSPSSTVPAMNLTCCATVDLLLKPAQV